ncbi:MAG: DNA alkylation repair protein [Candidatus Peribacteraceae bacterium]
MNAKLATAALQKLADPTKAAMNARFFKTKKGEYGYGDIFLGVTMPEMRCVAKTFIDLSLSEIQKLLKSPVHEVRMIGFIILTYQYEKGTEKAQKNIIDFYLKNLKRANNWDLVDVSCAKILGDFLIGKKKDILLKLAASSNLWEQRVSIVSTHAFIRENDLTMTMRLAKQLLGHQHDLMHKAVGWMLREAGKRDVAILKQFLDAHAVKMPRTMLRYAIEKFDEKNRQRYLKKR